MVQSCRSFCAMRRNGHSRREDALPPEPCNIPLVAGRLPPWSPGVRPGAPCPRKARTGGLRIFLRGPSPRRPRGAVVAVPAGGAVTPRVGAVPAVGTPYPAVGGLSPRVRAGGGPSLGLWSWTLLALSAPLRG